MTTIIETNSFKRFCDEFLSSVKESRKTASDFLNESTSIFPVTKAAVAKRFKSYYKKTISEEINSRLTPSKVEILEAMIYTANVVEFWDKLNIPNHMKIGFFDKWFEVSNYTKAKAKALTETLPVEYEPSIYENLSLVCSQLLGDAHYCEKRGSLNIVHGEKQIEYGIWKASLFNKAFPTTRPAGSTSILKHKQGHLYSSWYSGRLPSKITTFIKETSVVEWIEELTPFGLLLYFLDDASINLDLTKRTNSYVVIHVPFGEKAVNKLQEVLLSYGIGTTVDCRNNVKIGTMSGAVMFYKNFIEPFKNEIPNCMLYKTELKI